MSRKTLSVFGAAVLVCIAEAFAESPRLSGSERGMVVNPGTDAVIPQLVDGAGWKTSVFLTNLDSKPINFALIFLNDQGEITRVPIAQVGNVGMVYGSLGLNASATIETEGAATALLQGYAVIATTDRQANDPAAQVTTDKIAGLAIFRQSVPGRPDYEAVVPISPMTETQLVLPFDNRNGFSTGVAVVNPDANNAANVDFTFRDESGSIVKQESIRVPAGAKVTFSLPDRFPETRLRSGRLNLRSTGVLLSALGLRFNPSGAFTSFHSLSVDPSIAPPPAPAAPSGGTLPGISQTCSALNNAQIYADDGTYLGRITTNQYQSDSIANEYGRYGSPYSSTSIFNTVGQYGSTVSALSAFNTVATRPPVIFVNSTPVAYLSVNNVKTPRVDPALVLSCVGRRR